MAGAADEEIRSAAAGDNVGARAAAKELAGVGADNGVVGRAAPDGLDIGVDGGALTRPAAVGESVVGKVEDVGAMREIGDAGAGAAVEGVIAGGAAGEGLGIGD